MSNGFVVRKYSKLSNLAEMPRVGEQSESMGFLFAHLFYT